VNFKRKTIGIVGGGLLGMTLALRLALKSFKVTLIENAPDMGGLASACRIGPYTWDRFYHVILPSDSNLLSLLTEMNLADQIHWGPTKTGFFADGRLHSMSNLFEFLTFPPLHLIDKARLGWTILYASKITSWKRLEKISVREWLMRHSGRRAFDRIWLPLLKSKLGANYTIANAAFIWAIIARMYAARHTALKQERFGYLEGGYARILDRFQSRLEDIGVETLCRKQVRKIESNGRRVRLYADGGNLREFDSLLLTIPCSQIPDLCHQLSSSEKDRLLNVTYQGVLCLSLILKRPLAEYYITNITDAWVPFTGVIEMTSLVDKKYFDGNSLIYLPRYLIQNDPYWKRSNEEIVEEFLSALESMYPSFGRADVLFSKISKARYVHPITTLNYSRDLLPPTTTSLRNVFVVNSAQINGTMTVDETVGLANRKANEVANYLQLSANIYPCVEESEFSSRNPGESGEALALATQPPFFRRGVVS
jgi:protoporphyrinogen oxidase